MSDGIKSILKKLRIEYLLLFLLSIAAFASLFHNHLATYLLKSIEQITLSIGLLIELHQLALDLHHIPLLGESAHAPSGSPGAIVKYLSWSDMIVTVQWLLIKVTKTIVFKIFLVLSIGSLLIPTYRQAGLKLLLILLLINPGLPAYVTLTQYVGQEVQLNDGTELHEKIQAIHQKYADKEQSRAEKEAQRRTEQLQKAEARGKDDISGLKKVEDSILDDAGKEVSKVEEGVAEGVALLRAGSKEMLILSINYVVTLAIQFLLFPFLYMFIVMQLAKRFINKGLSESFVKKLVLFISITVLISCTTLLFAKDKSPANRQLSENITKTSLTLAGLDVSHIQGTIDWNKIKSAGFKFAYAKATEGDTFVDPNYKENRNGAMQVGVPIGAYHFYKSDDDPIMQAEHFVATVKPIAKGNMPPVLDLEEAGISAGIDQSQFQKDVLRWLEYVERQLALKPIIYTNHSFSTKYLTDDKLSQYGLWIAEYSEESEPKIPDPWKKAGWLIWQKSARGTVKGIESPRVDHDVFNGNEADLAKLLSR